MKNETEQDFESIEPAKLNTTAQPPVQRGNPGQVTIPSCAETGTEKTEDLVWVHCGSHFNQFFQGYGAGHLSFNWFTGLPFIPTNGMARSTIAANDPTVVAGNYVYGEVIGLTRSRLQQTYEILSRKFLRVADPKEPGRFEEIDLQASIRPSAARKILAEMSARAMGAPSKPVIGAGPMEQAMIDDLRTSCH
jgi:hypothetical protein